LAAFVCSHKQQAPYFVATWVHLLQQLCELARRWGPSLRQNRTHVCMACTVEPRKVAAPTQATFAVGGPSVTGTAQSLPCPVPDTVHKACGTAACHLRRGPGQLTYVDCIKPALHKHQQVACAHVPII
jgi:hypothetical protein